MKEGNSSLHRRLGPKVNDKQVVRRPLPSFSVLLSSSPCEKSVREASGLCYSSFVLEPDSLIVE